MRIKEKLLIDLDLKKNNLMKNIHLLVQFVTVKGNHSHRFRIINFQFTFPFELHSTT